MSKIKLDLSQFKHVRSNAKTTTLRHKDGHELTIAHQSLSPEGQAQLSQLAKMAQTPSQSDELKHKGMAEGGKTEDVANMDFSNSEDDIAGDDPQDIGDEPPVNAKNQKLEESKKSPSRHPSYSMPAATPMAQGGNAGEKRKEIFGTKSSPSNPDMRAKHMEHISQYSEKNFGMPIQLSGGKIDPKTGERRDENPELGVDKPDWRSGQLEAQNNPDAMVHELAHLLLLPHGMPLKEGQKYMDKQYAQVQKDYGYMKQKQSQGEIQPMAIENILRRHLGLPAATQSVPVKPGQGPRMSVDTKQPAAVRVKKGEKAVDLIRQSRLLSPENRKRMDDFVNGRIKFHPKTGWQDNADQLNAKSTMYKEQNPNAVKKMAEGGDVDEPQAPQSPSPGDPNPQKAKDAIKGLNKPADEQLSEGWQRLLHPSTWMAEGGEVNDMAYKPTPDEAATMGTMVDTPVDYQKAAQITPEQVDMAQNMAMGTMGTTKMAAIPETIGPELQATATKLSQALQKYGIDHQVTQSLAQKLKGLHESLGQYSGMAEGGKTGEPPASLDANAPNLDEDVTQVPTQMSGMSMSPEQQQGWESRQAYQKAHDMDLMTNAGDGVVPITREQMAMKDQSKQRHAVEAGLNNVAIMKEDKETAALKNKEQQLQTSKLNSQLAALGLPPMPGTNQPNAVDPAPAQPEPQMNQALNYGAQPAMKAPGDDTFDKYEGMIGKGYGEQLQGINKAADVAGQRGGLEEQALAKDMQNKQSAANVFQDQFKALNQERLNHVQDIQNGHIDPEQYWKGVKNPVTGEMEGGHSKLLTAIGMIISGWNPAGLQGNGAVDMMRYQMDRNLEAQKMNLQSKQNLLAANLHQFNNLRDATDMTRIMQHDMVANELQQAAAKTASPAAKAAALQASGQLRMAVAPLMQQFAMRRAFMKLANGGDQAAGATEQMLNYMEASGMPQAKEMRDRYVPGLGIAATAVPQEVKDRINAYQNVERIMNQTMQFAKDHEYNLSALSPSEQAAGKTLQNELMSQIRTAEKQGVYKESEAKFMQDTLGGNPASFFNAVRTQPKLLEMQSMKTNEYHNLLQNLGGNLMKNAQSVHPQVVNAPQAQQQTVTGADGKSYVRQMINGKAYMVPVNH